VAERAVEDSTGADGPSDRFLTVPNVLSLLRLAGVPLFLWLLLGPEADLAAIVVLIASGITDWLDGKLARWLNQSSRLGALLDPAIDRLYIIAALIAFGVRAIVPWWVIALLVGRDLLVLGCLPVLRRLGYGPFEVTYIGKAATFCLLYAFPLLLLAQGDSTAADFARPAAYAVTTWGVALYVWSAVLYFVQLGLAVRAAPDG
jgi:cardiolipin synthase